MAATESGRVQVVFTANVGSPLTADVAPGATVIFIDDTSDFDTDGTLHVAGQTVGYTAVDDDTGRVTLAAAVTAAADAGDLVTLWDTGLDEAAVEYRAHVELPGVLDNADAVDATIRHTLIGYLDEGIRAPGTGESVRMQRQGSDWVIVDMLGKEPSFQPSVISGGGAATGAASLSIAATGAAARVAGAASMTLASSATATGAAAPAAATGTASMTLAAAGTAGVPSTSVYKAAVLADAPVLYLRLGEASGTVAADSSTGTPVNGTYQNSPTLAQPGLLDADPDTAVKFTTGGAQVLVTPTSKLDPPGTAYTVECWVQHLAAAAVSQYAFRWLGSGGLCALGFDTNGSAVFSTLYSGSSLNTLNSPLVNMRDGQPHHLVGVRDADNVYLYIDGLLAASGTRTLMNNTSSNNIQIGSDGGSTAFGGTVDEVAFYPSALSATRVAAHYTIGLGARSKPVWVADVAATGLNFDNHLTATLGTAPGTGDVIVASVQHQGGTVTSVTGCGATWVKAFGQTSGQAIDFWVGTGATAAGAVTANFGGFANGLMHVLLIRNLTATTVRAAHCEQGSIVSPGAPTASSSSDTSAAGRIVIAPQEVSGGFLVTLFSAFTPALGWGSVGGGGNALKWRVSLGSETVNTSISTTNTSSVDYGIGQLVLGP